MIGDEPAIRAEFDLLYGQIKHERLEEHTLGDLFKKPSMRKRCIIGFLTLFGCQATGTLVINSKYLRKLGVGSDNEQIMDRCCTRLWGLAQ